MATVIIASSKANTAKRIEFTGSTFGELKTHAEFSPLWEEGSMEAVVKPGNVTLRDNASVLPEGNFNVYLIPSKNKAGFWGRASDAEEFAGQVQDEVESFLQDMNTATLSILMETLKNKMVELRGTSAAPCCEDEVLEAALEEAKNM